MGLQKGVVKTPIWNARLDRTYAQKRYDLYVKKLQDASVDLAEKKAIVERLEKEQENGNSSSDQQPS